MQIIENINGLTHTIIDAQVLTYLRLTGCPLGLLMNFKVAKFTDGITRLVNPHRRLFTGGELDSKV